MSNKKDTQKQLQIWEKTLHSILVNIKEHLSMFSFFWFRPYSSRVIFFWHFFEFFQDFQSAGQNSKSRMEFWFRFIKLGIFGKLTCPTFSFQLICPLISPPLLNFLMLKLKICRKLEKFTSNSTSGDFPQTPTMSFWWPDFLKYWCFSLVQGF